MSQTVSEMSTSTQDDQDQILYDWNEIDAPAFPRVQVDDETLRDGLQSPSIREPSLDQKIEILELMVKMGIRRGDIGLPMSAQLDDIKGFARLTAADDIECVFQTGIVALPYSGKAWVTESPCALHVVDDPKLRDLIEQQQDGDETEENAAVIGHVNSLPWHP